MKTDLTTFGSYAQGQAKNLKAVEQAKLKDAAKLAQASKLPSSSPDYKLDLSSTASSPSAPAVDLPSLPTPPVPSPSLPSVKPLELKPEKLVEEAGKDKAKDQVKEEAAKKLEEAKAVEAKAGTLKKPAIIFIKGLDVFSSPSKSESGYAGVGRIAESVKGSRIYGWNQKDEILKEINKIEKSQKVILVGHSFGGDTAVEIANTLDSLEHKFRPVDLLVTIDAIGFNNDIIPQNVKKHLNVFGENDFFLNDGPHVARRNEKTHVQNILSPLDHTELDDDKEIQFELVTLIQDTLGSVS